MAIDRAAEKQQGLHMIMGSYDLFWTVLLGI